MSMRCLRATSLPKHASEALHTAEKTPPPPPAISSSSLRVGVDARLAHVRQQLVGHLRQQRTGHGSTGRGRELPAGHEVAHGDELDDVAAGDTATAGTQLLLVAVQRLHLVKLRWADADDEDAKRQVTGGDDGVDCVVQVVDDALVGSP